MKNLFKILLATILLNFVFIAFTSAQTQTIHDQIHVIPDNVDKVYLVVPNNSYVELKECKGSRIIIEQVVEYDKKVKENLSDFLKAGGRYDFKVKHDDIQNVQLLQHTDSKKYILNSDKQIISEKYYFRIIVPEDKQIRIVRGEFSAITALPIPFAEG